MKSKLIPIFTIFFLLLTGCDDSDLLEDYMADQPRIIAMKTTPPEAAPGETVSARILVSGSSVQQSMTNTVTYFISEDINVGMVAYNEDFVFDIPLNVLDETDWFHFPVFARVSVDNKTLTVQKKIKITSEPVGKNPVITHVEVIYFDTNGETVTDTISEGETLILNETSKSVGFTVITETLSEGDNEKLVYNWYTSTEAEGAGRLYVNTLKDDINTYFNTDETVSDTGKHVLYWLYGEEGDDGLQPGYYTVYCVVRDNAENAQSREEERLGTDFIWFNLCVGSDC